ncbi:MAG: hypothetical protein KF789_10860, partial [Bdellovibrionaceae bacterium]|nr:hypothetical protein [Pseudobdellovibrionaceae bacterium]
MDQSVLPPTAQELVEKPEQKNVLWWKAFRDGDAAMKKKDRRTACGHFRVLAANREFPLFELATLRAYEACTDTAQLTPTDSLSTEAQTWFEETSVRARLNHSAELPFEAKVRLAWDQARLEKNERKREHYLGDALSIAEKSGDKALLEAAQNKLWNNSPRLKPKPEKKDLPAVVRDLRRWREFRAAVQLERKRLKDRTLT